MKKISIICIYNNYERLNEQLIKSLSFFEKKNFELVLVDNSQHIFKSAADALNYGANKANGEVLLFSHQDFYIKDENEFYDFAHFIELHDKVVLGVAGAIEKDKINYTNCTSGKDLIINKIENNREIRKVSCIDECFFGLTKNRFLEHNFDSTLCDDWHFYAVEMSLYARKNWGGRLFISNSMPSF